MSTMSDSSAFRPVPAEWSTSLPVQPAATRRSSLFKNPGTIFSPTFVPGAFPAEDIAGSPSLMMQNPLPASALSLLSGDDSASLSTEFEQQQTWRLPVINASGGGVQITLQLLAHLVRDSGIYAAVSCLSPLLSLVLTPFLTHSLSRTDYGVLTILNATLVFLVGLTQCGLSAAFTYVYNTDYSHSQQSQQQLFLALFCLITCSSLICTIAFGLAANLIAQYLFQDSTYASHIRLTALQLLFLNLGMPGLTWLRLRGRVRLFAGLTGLGAICNLSLTLFLVAVWHTGCSGALWGGTVSALVSFLGTLPLLVSFVRTRFRLSMAYDLFAFGISTLPGLISVWVLQLMDRYFLLATGSLAFTAGYSVAYTIGNVAAPLVIAPFSLAWYSLLHTVARYDTAREIFRRVFRCYSALLLFSGCAIVMSAHLLLHSFFPPSYSAMVDVIPLIALSNVCYGLFDLFSVGVQLQGKVWYSAFYLPAVAVLNLVLNFLLIPPFGVIGAAVSTALSYFALAVIAYAVNRRLYPLPFEFWRFIFALLSGAGCCAVDRWLMSCSFLSAAAHYILPVLLLSAYAILLLAMYRLPLMRWLFVSGKVDHYSVRIRGGVR